MFSKRCDSVFRGWLGSARAEGTKMPENSGVFRRSLPLWKGIASVASRVRNLNNTVWKTPFVGSVQTTPDPNTSAKVSRYKWEPHRDTNWWCILLYYFLPRGGYTFAKVSR